MYSRNSLAVRAVNLLNVEFSIGLNLVIYVDPRPRRTQLLPNRAPSYHEARVQR